MSLRTLAEADLSFLIEDLDGFGVSVTVTDPDGVSTPFTGLSNDISAVVDVNTGLVISGRSATLTLRISSLIRQAVSIPRGVHDPKSKPWTVRVADLNGVAADFKVVRSDPDKTIGTVVLHLEAYRAA